jgi:hypothetical protein
MPGDGRIVARFRERLLEVARARQQRHAAAVIDLQQERHLRQPRSHTRQRRGEAGVIDDRARVGVREQIDQLLVDVAIVDVERRHPGLEGAEHALEILGAVVEVEREVVLTRFPRRQGVTLAVTAEPRGSEHVGQAAGALLQLPPRETAIRRHDRLAVGDRLGERFVDVSERKLHGRTPLATFHRLL